MEQQKKDEKRGVTYNFLVALDSNMVLDYIRVSENKKQELLKVTCPFLVVLYWITLPMVPKSFDTMGLNIWDI